MNLGEATGPDHEAWGHAYPSRFSDVSDQVGWGSVRNVHTSSGHRPVLDTAASLPRWAHENYEENSLPLRVNVALLKIDGG